ncbi:MAG: DNA mismatch repair endonuclease MutL [Myxococcota bacterium]|nr:DNA mismatch repair endonuclease MutL [Myxococcota bacterium]
MIRVLEDRVINKIAAGEVVERPASVVKELVENAVDAGATVLKVELKAGGRTLIRVSDNGTGMDRHDATLCIERHATSKIRTDADLFEVKSLGFRGEAMPSIAAVGRFEMRTRLQGSDVGTRVAIEGGTLVDISDTGCPMGTDIALRSIFYNIPARRKFLRTAGTELSHCLEAVVRQVLTRPDIDVEVVHDGRTVIRAPAVKTMAERASDLLGPHGRALVPARFEEGPLKMQALMSPVGVHRASTRGATYLYVNGRFVADMVLRRAVREAYRGLVPKGRHPTIVLDVQIPPDHVDVNVHPAKTEVRFRFAYDLTDAVSRGLRAGLEAHGIKKPVAVEPRYQPAAESRSHQAPLPLDRIDVPVDDAKPEPSVLASVDWSLRAPTERSAAEGPPVGLPERDAPEGPRAAPASAPVPLASSGADARDLLPVPRFSDLQVLGQLAKTYILCEGAGELVVIDQHAAHERVMLHQLMRDPQRHLGSGKRLLTPAVVELSPSRAAALTAHVDGLAKFNFEIEPFGGNSVAVKQVPAALGHIPLQQLVEDVSDDIIEGGSGRPADDVVEHVLATMACHSSIRAGQTLSVYEMRALLTAIDKVDFSVCAHGRPVSIRIGSGELEKRFHRS